MSCFLFTICGSYESAILYCILHENHTFLSVFLKENFNIYYNDNNINLKNNGVLIYKNETNNKNSYKYLENKIVIFDNIFRGCLYTGFIITILYFIIF